MTRINPRPTAAALAIAATLTLTGCTPAPELTSPIGVWRATGDDNGTLAINADGTFTITDASFDLIWSTDTDNNFHGNGTWRVASNDIEVILEFKEAANGDFPVEPTAPSADYTSGTIRFEDPEQTVDIEFRLTD